MNPVEFRRRYPAGTFIVRVAKHVFVVRNGEGDRCIYTAWKVEGPGA